jgi:hypothetical protein
MIAAERDEGLTEAMQPPAGDLQRARIAVDAHDASLGAHRLQQKLGVTSSPDRRVHRDVPALRREQLQRLPKEY